MRDCEFVSISKYFTKILRHTSCHESVSTNMLVLSKLRIGKKNSGSMHSVVLLTNPEWSIVRINRERLLTFAQYLNTAMVSQSIQLYVLCKIKENKIKNQVVESRSTQVRTIHEYDTQLLYGASGITVSEDGSCRASDTRALQGYVQMCMRSTLCSGDRHTTRIPTKS